MYNFTPRLVKPAQNSVNDTKYYFSNKNGYWSAGYGMPNCTAYALGRINELLDLNNMSYPQNDGFLGSAGLWGDTGIIGQSWEHSDIPQLGAIAVFTQAGHDGHDAVVEAINPDGTVTLSNSGWAGSSEVGNENNARWFWLSYNVDVHHHGSYTFKTFLYPPYIDVPVPPPPPPVRDKNIIPLMICGALSNQLK